MFERQNNNNGVKFLYITPITKLSQNPFILRDQMREKLSYDIRSFKSFLKTQTLS